MPTYPRNLAARVSASAVRPVIISFILIALYFINISYNITRFYKIGAGDDSGWFSWLASNAYHWPMNNPDLIGGNFLSTHMSIIFFVTTFLLQPFSDFPVAVRFCCFISIWAPLLWMALYLLLDRFNITFQQRCSVSILLTFNGLMLSMLGFPHIEILIPAFGLLAVALCLRAKSVLGWATVGIIALLALTIREDAGLHLFLVLVAMTLASMWVKDRLTMRRLLGLAAFFIAGSILTLWVQRQGLPSGGQQLGNVYFGHPALSNVTIKSLANRIMYWATRREYIFLPFMLLLFLGTFDFSKNRLLLLGPAISLPWLSLSLIAVGQQAGDLWSYYCFPLTLMFFWPLLLGQLKSQILNQRLLATQIGMGGLSTVAFIIVGLLPHVGDGGSHDKAPWTHLAPPSLSLIRQTEESLTNRDGWLFDYGAAALVFGSLRSGQFRSGLVYEELDIKAARGFIRFIIEPNFLASEISTLEHVFPVCTTIEGTVMEICTRAPGVDTLPASLQE